MEEKGIPIKVLVCPVCHSTNTVHGFGIRTHRCLECGYTEQESLSSPYYSRSWIFPGLSRD